MSAISNHSGAGRFWSGALALLLAIACGGSAEQSSAEEPSRADEEAAPEPVPMGTEIEVEGGKWEPTPASLGPMVGSRDSPARCPWVDRGAMPIGRSGMASAQHGGLVYLFGGEVLDERTYSPLISSEDLDARRSSVQSYDPANDTWASKQRMPAGVSDLAASSVGDAIYVFTGFGSDGFANQVYRYEPATDTWSQTSRVPVYRARFMSEAVAGKVYLIGGSGQADDGPGVGGYWYSKAGLEIFDPATNTWSQGTPAPGAINGGASCVLGQRIFVFDGVVTGATYIYDTATNTWSEGAPAPEARTWMSCAVSEGKLLLLGGREPLSHEVDPVPVGPDAFGGKTIESSDLIQEYDPGTNTWREYGRMPRAREQFAAIPFGRELYLIGGTESHTKDGPYGSFILDEVVVFSNDAVCAR
jgi:N-acetylneuraminic acid mutarotase